MTHSVFQYSGEKKVILGLIGISAAFFILYGGIIFKTVFNIAHFEMVSKETGQISSEISRLEFSYLEKKNALTLSRAAELGLSRAENPLFTRRAGTVREALAR